MNNTLPYTAGYIDGDGCFFINKTSTNPIKYRAKIIISSTNYEILQFFKIKFGGHIKLMKIYNQNWKKQFQWIINANKSLKLSNCIKNFLIERNEEANILTNFISTKNKIIKQELIKKMKNHRNFNKHITREIFEDIKNFKYKGNFTEENAAYLAGFIDAECSFGISKYKCKNKPNYTYKIILQCTNTSPNIFYWFKEKFGGSFSFINRNAKNPKHRNQMSWNISSNKLYEVLIKIYPYLRSKKKTCKKMMEFHNLTLPNGGDRQSEKFKESYRNLLVKKEKIICDIHNLNSKGIKNV